MSPDTGTEQPEERIVPEQKFCLAYIMDNLSKITQTDLDELNEKNLPEPEPTDTIIGTIPEEAQKLISLADKLNSESASYINNALGLMQQVEQESAENNEDVSENSSFETTLRKVHELKHLAQAKKNEAQLLSKFAFEVSKNELGFGCGGDNLGIRKDWQLVEIFENPLVEMIGGLGAVMAIQELVEGLR